MGYGSDGANKFLAIKQVSVSVCVCVCVCVCMRVRVCVCVCVCVCMSVTCLAIMKSAHPTAYSCRCWTNTHSPSPHLRRPFPPP
jgi:hypothetical protein